MGQGGGQRQGYQLPNYFLSANGLHSNGSNFLLCDGHVKWLTGGQVSSGSAYSAQVAGIPPTQPTDRQDQNYPAYMNAMAAGTQSSQGWAATFSPI
jgi:prepilin-type processing-associated H-X9-DG protein